MLEFGDPPSSQFFLASIAQEEFAKGLLLCLVAMDVIPWNSLIYRATRDHVCKQLLVIIMDFLRPSDDEFDRRREDWRLKFDEYGRLLDALGETKSPEERKRIWERIDAINESWGRLPRTVADAINILRHEKIGRWHSWFVWAEEPSYDESAKDVGNGRADREKQDALYVRISKNGGITGTPEGVTRESAGYAMDKARRVGGLVEDLLDGRSATSDYEKIESALKAMFADLAAASGADSEDSG
jgi:hypothetical protein